MKKRKHKRLSQSVEMSKHGAYLQLKHSGKRASVIPNKKREASRKHCRRQ